MNSIFLATALRLPKIDVAALIQGQTIAAIVANFVNKGQSFALLADQEIVIEDWPLEMQYRPAYYLSVTQEAKTSLAESTSTYYWAKCTLCQVLDSSTNLEAVSKLTAWTKAFLEDRVGKQGYIFLVYLRVYRQDQSAEVLNHLNNQFVPLQHPRTISNFSPVLDDQTFAFRQQQLEKLEAPRHEELEDLYTEVIKSRINHLAAEQLRGDIKALLGWNKNAEIQRPVDSDLKWIEVIAQTGNSSDGNFFEKLVRKSFIKLGFQNNHPKLLSALDPEGCGGAGGLDFYCDTPYQVVGECKATKTTVVPDGTPAQLIKLGNKHLLSEEYAQCIKIILAAGQLNSHARQTAVGNKMNVIRPETLQRLVTMKAHHPGAVNLIELKPCLESSPFGEEADTKLNNYIDQIKQDLKIRSHLIKAIKQLSDTEPDRQQFEVVEIRVQYNALFSKLDGCNLDNQTVYELLIELSSPLAGYLGRVKVSGLNSDRFYFLRDLPIDELE